MQDSTALSETNASRSPFNSFFMAGFECSTLQFGNSPRLDMIEATQHEKFALLDYKRLRKLGFRVAREGVRWHLAEPSPGRFDFSSVRAIVQAARMSDTQVIWDLCHFGWPDDIDIFAGEFVERMSQYASAFARWLKVELDEPGFFVPVNEISFFSWAGGDEGNFRPSAMGRGTELKRQLVRASVVAMEAIWSQMPEARFLAIDPIIHVLASPRHPEEQDEAEACRRSQYQAWDMLAGRVAPELGGGSKYMDLLGVNFYPHNEWYYNLKETRRVRRFRRISRRSPQYRPFREMLREIYARYGRPILIAETGAENRLRAGWFRYVYSEVYAAMREGIPIYGICLYPILNHPGWTDQRHCLNGLWDYANAKGERVIYQPLARELQKAQRFFCQDLISSGFDPRSVSLEPQLMT